MLIAFAFWWRCLLVGISYGLAFHRDCCAENLAAARPHLAVERQVEGLGIRVVGDTGVLYQTRSGADLGGWTSDNLYISDDTNSLFWVDGRGTGFFQWVGDDQMRFPAWRAIIEKKLLFNFQPSQRGGSFQLDTYADSALWNHLEGNVNDWADPTTGIVWLVDAGETPADGYSYETFSFHLTWTPAESNAIPYSKVIVKPQRRRNTRAGVTLTNGLILQQNGVFGSVVQETTIAQQTIFSNCLGFIFQSDLHGVGLSQSNNPPTLSNAQDWTLFKQRLLTNHTLTHLHYFGDGSASHLGCADRPQERITTALMASAPRLPTNLLTYVGLDGFVSGEGDLLRYLLGYKQVMSGTEFGRDGLFRCFGWGWSTDKTNFTNNLHFEFIRAFYGNLGELNPSSFPRTSVWRFREAYERARRLPNGEENVESRGFRPIGCYNCYFPL